MGGWIMLSDIFVSAGDDFATYTKIVPAPFFRKRFTRNAGGKAVLTIGATGFYDLYLNGKKITDGYLMPYISNPEQIVFYNEYDLTHMLTPGENVIGVMLGNGYANPIGGEIWNHNKEGFVHNICFLRQNFNKINVIIHQNT